MILSGYRISVRRRPPVLRYAPFYRRFHAESGGIF
jgi:hypothetical protein